MTQKCGCNVSDGGVVNVTSSSVYSDYYAKNSVDLKNSQNFFCSNNIQNSWLRYDFIQNKVILTGYSIRTRHDYDLYHPRNWVIEGSNTGGENENEWMVLDSHTNDTTLRGTCFSHTFDIDQSKTNQKGYRYLRLRQTGVNSDGYHHLIFSALEYFGTLIEYK